jgi:hypothetical protein
MYSINFFFPFGCPWGGGGRGGGCPSPGACWAYPKAGPDSNKSTIEWGNHDMVIETRGLNIGDSSMRGQNSDGFFLWKNN